MSQARVFSWDWREQPSMHIIAAAVNRISGGTVYMRELDTGGDNYAWVVADHEVSDEEAWKLYQS
jgi:hypothetical protein